VSVPGRQSAGWRGVGQLTAVARKRNPRELSGGCRRSLGPGRGQHPAGDCFVSVRKVGRGRSPLHRGGIGGSGFRTRRKMLVCSVSSNGNPDRESATPRSVRSTAASCGSSRDATAKIGSARRASGRSGPVMTPSVIGTRLSSQAAPLGPSRVMVLPGSHLESRKPRRRGHHPDGLGTLFDLA
jgi:hypothetical protein